MVQQPAPCEIKIRPKRREVAIVWSDGHMSVYPMEYLRQRCPCARCQQAREGQEAPAERADGQHQEITVTNAYLVGNYAVRFVWSDGHETGFYDYGYLRRIDPAEVDR